jgi:UDP-glucose 4-epimerase
LLVTGSSGRLGKRLMKLLAERGHYPIGIDLRPGRSTDTLVDIADGDALRSVFEEGRFDGILHGAALHRPDLGKVPDERFPLVNIVGTRNLLELAVQHGVSRFVYTSTTAVMTDAALANGSGGPARWLTEEGNFAPADLYGETKLAAERLCQKYRRDADLRLVILRPSRFFHRDRLPHSETFTQANHRANEFLFRRAAVDDVAKAHALAIEQADSLGSDVFIISAPTPFARSDCAELASDAPAVVKRYFSQYPRVYAARGWKMYDTIDRVYSSERAETVLGLRFSQTFADQL